MKKGSRTVIENSIFVGYFYKMASHIPISFDHNGTHYKGHFNEMTNGRQWHLMINNFYRGQLIYSPTFGFNFYSNKGHFEDLSEFFGEYIMGWYG